MSETLLDRIKWRILGAVELADDVTGARLRRPFTLSAAGVTTARTATGRYAVTMAPGLAAHTRAFEVPPAAPVPGAAPVTLRIDDPLGDFLPRLAVLPLPRSPNAAPGEPDLFAPARIAMLPAPRRAAADNWAVLRLSVTRTGGAPLQGVLVELRTTDAGATLLGRGLSDRRGEAVVAVAGLPLTRAVDDADPLADVTTPVTQARVGLVADPDLPWPIDPDRLAANRDTLPVLSLATPVDLTAGGAEHRPVTFDP
jgi:hypothetical protein